MPVAPSTSTVGGDPLIERQYSLRSRTVRPQAVLAAILSSPGYSRLRYAPQVRRALRDAEATGSSRAPRLAYRPMLRNLASGSRSVLDVGTGLMHSLADLPCPVKIGLEAHRPYLEHRRVPEAVPVNASALELEAIFVQGSVDLVSMIDVLEHFEPADAASVLRQAESVAHRRVVLFTPRGHFPQEGHDAFGLGGEELQQHRSQWEPEDLTSRGYRVVVLEGYHGPWNSSFVESFGADAPPVDALLAWKDRASG